MKENAPRRVVRWREMAANEPVKGKRRSSRTTCARPPPLTRPVIFVAAPVSTTRGWAEAVTAGLASRPSARGVRAAMAVRAARSARAARAMRRIDADPNPRVVAVDLAMRDQQQQRD